MISSIDLLHGLSSFYGPDTWYSFNPLVPNVLLTEGAKYLADNAEAYWLMDLIAANQDDPKIRAERFQVWRIKRNDKTKNSHNDLTITVEDGNDHVVATRDIFYSDFPLREYSIWAIYDGNNLVILLPNEY